MDGTGSGHRAKVSDDNQLHVLASTIPYQHHVAHTHGKAYRAVVQQTPSAANKAFLYIENNDSVDLNVWKGIFRCTALEAFEIWSVTGTAVGTNYTPVNAIVGSGSVATITCVVGDDITGLVKDKLLCRLWVEAGKALPYFFDAAIIVEQHRKIAYYAVTGSSQVDICMTFDFHNAE